MSAPWIGVDLDGTLAHYNSGQWPQIGDPIALMVERVKTWHARGIPIRILTARAGITADHVRIQAWCQQHLGFTPPITDKKDFDMILLFDDRAIGVKSNTGRYDAAGAAADKLVLHFKAAWPHLFQQDEINQSETPATQAEIESGAK
jgi:hypothetical protein